MVLAVFTPVFSSVVLQSSLGAMDRALGFLFGVARGILLIVIGYMVYGYLSVADFEAALADDARAPVSGIEPIDKAASKKFLDDFSTILDKWRPREMPEWLSGRIDALMAPCIEASPAPAAPAAPTTPADPAAPTAPATGGSGT